MGHLPDLSTNFVPLNFAPDHDPDDLFSLTVEAMLAAADCGTINRDKVVRLGEPFPDTVLYCMRISFMTPGEYARVVTYEQVRVDGWGVSCQDQQLCCHVYCQVHRCLCFLIARLPSTLLH